MCPGAGRSPRVQQERSGEEGGEGRDRVTRATFDLYTGDRILL